MSLLIKGIEMPENCHECKFVDILPTCPCNKMADDDFWNNASLAVEGHKDCPIIGVLPHGRLIDADALSRDFPIRRDRYDREHGDEHFINGIETVIEYVEYMPTILEANEAE